MEPTLTGIDSDGFEYNIYPMADRFDPPQYYKTNIRVYHTSDNKTLKDMFHRIMTDVHLPVKREKIGDINYVLLSSNNFIASLRSGELSVLQLRMAKECIGRFMNAFNDVMIVDK